MKRPTLSHLTPLFIACALFASGCGDEPAADPQKVIETAFPDQETSGEPATGAEVEVASLGFEDRVLDSRLLSVESSTYGQIRGAISGSASKSEGLFGLADGIETVGSEDQGGVEVDHVTGDFDVKALVDELEGSSDDVGAAAASLPGVGELDELRDKLVAADFDLYAESETGDFEQLDLTLSIDDRENASPPTRIRFSMTESDQ